MSTSADVVINPTRDAIWFRTGPPRILRGLSVRGRAVRYGVILPPERGPARAAALEATGSALLREARRGYGRVLREVLAVAGADVPPPADRGARSGGWPTSSTSTPDASATTWSAGCTRRVTRSSGCWWSSG